MKRKFMPWKNPDSWQWLLQAEFLAPVLAAVTALLRAAYDDDEPKWLKIMLESSVCGFVAIGVGAGLAEFGFDSDNARLAAASCVGLYGVDWVRNIGNRIADKRIKKQ